MTTLVNPYKAVANLEMTLTEDVAMQESTSYAGDLKAQPWKWSGDSSFKRNWEKEHQVANRDSGEDKVTDFKDDFNLPPSKRYLSGDAPQMTSNPLCSGLC